MERIGGIEVGFADGKGAAGVLPVAAVQFPSAEHGVQEAAVARGTVDIEETDPSVAVGRMRMPPGHLPNGFEIAPGQ